MATKIKPTIVILKFMLMVMKGMKGFYVVDLMTSQDRFSSQYFVGHITMPLLEEIFPHSRNRHARRLHIHLDHCRVYFSKVAKRFFEANAILGIPHPPYSPKLAPSDLLLFGWIKTALRKAKFDQPRQLLDGITELLDTISVEE
jgi:hypothetical protein